MLGADSRQAGDFVFGEDLLSGFNSDHPLPSSAGTTTAQLRYKWISGHKTTPFLSNRPAVY
jgi:hypothetical protein